jgi:HD-like signal output (HDOD) protein
VPDDRRERRGLSRPGRDVEIDQLPVLPGVMVRLMSLSPESEELFEDVLEISRQDPGLALRVIRTANSPMSAPISPIDTIEGAIARLGASHVMDLVTTVAVARVFVPSTPGETDLWLHAIEVATASRTIIEQYHVQGITTGHAYLAGLLHDIGRFVLFDQSPQFIRAVDDLAWTTPTELIDAERQICGIDHAELGGRVCAHWDVPERIRTVVHDHHRALADTPPAVRALLGVVKLADWVSIWHRSHDGTDEMTEALAMLPEISATLGEREPNETATDLAKLLPEMLAAGTRAAHDLGLITRCPG